MINERNAKTFCREDISKIENYDKAIADTERVWDIHHRLEIQGPFINSAKLLKKCGLYYSLPASQLIFLTHAEHMQLHMKGKHRSDHTRRKISESLKGHRVSIETRRKISELQKGRIPWNKGKPQSDETKRKLSESHKQLWTEKDRL